MSTPRMIEPSIVEREAGYHLARFADQEAAKKPNVRERCDTCAFRLGTDANTYAPTILNAAKCVMEHEPFYCHEGDPAGPLPICAGYALLVRPDAEPIPMPWGYVSNENPDGEPAR
jgi:hypothetical protein